MAASSTARVVRQAGKLRSSRTFGITGLALWLASGLAWASPPNPTPSDTLGNTAGGTDALYYNLTVPIILPSGSWALLNNLRKRQYCDRRQRALL
jgi:hypothetical protein